MASPHLQELLGEEETEKMWAEKEMELEEKKENKRSSPSWRDSLKKNIIPRMGNYLNHIASKLASTVINGENSMDEERGKLSWRDYILNKLLIIATNVGKSVSHIASKASAVQVVIIGVLLLLLIMTITATITFSSNNSTHSAAQSNSRTHQLPSWFSQWLMNTAGGEELQLWCERVPTEDQPEPGGGWRIECHSKPKAERTDHKSDVSEKSLNLQGEQHIKGPDDAGNSLCCHACFQPPRLSLKKPNLFEMPIKAIIIKGGITNAWDCARTFVYFCVRASIKLPKTIITRPWETLNKILFTVVRLPVAIANGLLHIIYSFRDVIEEIYYEVRDFINLDDCQHFSSTLSDGFEKKLRGLLEEEIEKLLEGANCIYDKKSCQQILAWKIGNEFNKKFESVLQSTEHVIERRIEEKKFVAPSKENTRVATQEENYELVR